MKTIGTVLLVLVAVMGMAMPVLGEATSSSGSSAWTDGDYAGAISTTGALTGDSDWLEGTTNAGATSVAGGYDSASTDAGSSATDDSGSYESSDAGTSGSGDDYSISTANSYADNFWTGEAGSESFSVAVDDASTSADSEASYEYLPPSGDLLEVNANSGTSASGDDIAESDTGSYAETYWGAPTDYVTAGSGTGVTADDYATSYTCADAGDLDGDGSPDVAVCAGSYGEGNANTWAGSGASSIWE